MIQNKLVTVIGATGAQGGSVVDFLLKSPNKYSIRAVTRNSESTRARELAARGVELVQANVDEIPSLIQAFKGSYAIFAITNFVEHFVKAGADQAAADVASRAESLQGENIVTAAETVQDTLQHFLWSTLPDAKRVTQGRIHVPHYQSKTAIEDLIRSKPALLAKTTFVRCGLYATNFNSPFLKPGLFPPAKVYLQMQAVPAETLIACIGDPRANLGAFVIAILDRPSTTRQGATVYAYTETLTIAQLLQTWAKAHNVKAQYLQLQREDYLAMFPYGAVAMDYGMQFWSSAKTNWFREDGSLNFADLDVDVAQLLSIEDSMRTLPLD